MTKVGIEVMSVKRLSGDTNLKAYADVKLGDSVVIKGFSVMKNKSGHVDVLMPRRPSKDGKWFDTISLTSDALRREIEDRVLEAYERENIN